MIKKRWVECLLAIICNIDKEIFQNLAIKYGLNVNKLIFPSVL